MLYNKVPEYRVDNGNKELNWLQYRKGMWRVVLTLSTFEYRQIESLKVKNVLELEEKLKLMFREIQAPFTKHCPKERKNFLSYAYVLYKFLEILGENKLKNQYLNYHRLEKNHEG